MASKTVEFGVVTYGNDNTNNFLNNTQGGYDGVVENMEMGKPTVADLESIATIKVGSEKGDLIDGIVVGQDVLIRVNNKKAYNRIMLIVTDGETEVTGMEDLEVIVGQMKEITNFGLYVALLGKVDDQSSVVKKENAKLLQSIAESANGRFMEVQDVGDSCHLLSTGLGLGTRPQASKLSLEISGALRIPCQVWGMVSKATVPSLKKKARVAAGTGVRRGGDEEGAGGAVKRDTTYRNPEDPDQELGAEERVKGYKYGSQYVPIAAADEDLFKVAGPQGVQVLGFLPTHRVPRHHYMESPMILQGASDNGAAQLGICALATAIRQSGLVGLARFVKRENGDPFLAVLMPTDEPGDCSLLVHRLPCCEDIREYSFPSLIAFASPAAVQAAPALSAQDQAMRGFVDALTVKQAPAAALTPINFTLQEVYTEVYRRLIGAPTVVHASDPLGESPPPTMAGLDANAVAASRAAVGAAFELVKSEAAAGSKRKVYWSELDIKGANGEAVGTASAAADAVPRYEMDLTALGGEGRADAATPEVPPFTVGSVTAVEDFQAVMAAAPACGVGASEVVRGAMRTMCDIVERNVTIGASNAHYKRAVACIAALRTAALAEGEHALFNSFMRDRVKAPYSAGRHRAAWQMVAGEGLTLISTDEDSGADASPRDAADFLTEQQAAAPVAAAAPVEEEEDLFGNMA